jgi:hypothetical protein
MRHEKPFGWNSEYRVMNLTFRCSFAKKIADILFIIIGQKSKDWFVAAL